MLSKRLKECAMIFLDSNIEVTYKSRLSAYTTAVPSMRNALLKALSSMLAAVGVMNPASNLYKGFSKKEEGQQLNRLFLSDGLRRMLGGKGYRSLDMVYPFVPGFLDICIGMSERPMLTTVYTLFSNFLVKVYVGLRRLSWNSKF